jgi:glycosyltransferase involved in cell wall biosynthesis
VKVLVFPKDANPYQELLYRPMREKYPDISIDYLTGPSANYQTINVVLLPLVLLLKRLQGYRIFHLHWTYLFRIPRLNRSVSRFLMQYFSIATVGWIKLLGYKLVWTAHDHLPHAENFRNARAVNKCITTLADVVIVHSAETIVQMQEIDLCTRRAVVVPIGSYGDIYKDDLSEAEARAKLGIGAAEFVFLFFGLIRRYKCVDQLIDAFSALDIPTTRLLIAGQCQDDSLKGTLRSASQHARISLHEGFVPDDDVATYFRASNVVCLPFRETTTSSTALLTLSFGRPLIAPALGTIRDLPPESGFYYDPLVPNALLDSMQKSLSEKADLARRGSAGKQYSKSLSWDVIAESTHQLYVDISAR